MVASTRVRRSTLPISSAFLLLLGCSPASGYVYSNSCRILPSLQRETSSRRRSSTFVRLAKPEDLSAGDRDDKKGGYQFGDISRGLARKFAESVKDVTGKDEYKFGDLSRHIDKIVKEKVADTTGKDYEFGNISRYLDKKAKEKVNEFTGKTEYEVGDLTKEVLRKVMNGDYKLEDLVFMCKILLAVGANFSPVASLLPGKLLIEMLEVSLVQEMGGKLVEALSLELDRRMKAAVTGDENYALGDITKKAINRFIGKEEYSFGDITKTVTKNIEEAKNNPEKSGGLKSFLASATAEKGAPPPTAIKSAAASNDFIDVEAVKVSDLDPKIIQELLDWDRAIGAVEEKKQPDSKENT